MDKYETIEPIIERFARTSAYTFIFVFSPQSTRTGQNKVLKSSTKFYGPKLNHLA